MKRGVVKSGRHALNSLVGLLNLEGAIAYGSQPILESLTENSKGVNDSITGQQTLQYAFDAMSNDCIING